MTRSFALANELTDELVNADAIIISTPMYNWSLPSALKAWVDRVINCRTFYQRTDTIAKIPVTFIVVSGTIFSPILDELVIQLPISQLSPRN